MNLHKKWMLGFLIIPCVLIVSACNKSSKEPDPDDEIPIIEPYQSIESVLTDVSPAQVKLAGEVFLITSEGFYLADSEEGLIFIDIDLSLLPAELNINLGLQLQVEGTFVRVNHQPKIIAVTDIDLAEDVGFAVIPSEKTIEDVMALSLSALKGHWYHPFTVLGTIVQEDGVFGLRDLEDNTVWFTDVSDYEVLAEHLGVRVNIDVFLTHALDQTWGLTFVDDAGSISLAPYDDEDVEAMLHAYFSEYISGDISEGNLTLPISHPIINDGITWTTSNDTIMRVNGEVTYGYVDRDVILTAHVEVNGVVYTFAYTIIVKGEQYQAASRTDYRYLQDYEDELFEVVEHFSDIVKLHIIGYSFWGLPIYALEIADNPGEHDGRPESYHMGLLHASEWPSGEIAMELIWYLVQNYHTDPRVTELLTSTRVFISPVVNPDGFYTSRDMNISWRKNRTPNADGSFGTDLNRNFSYEWAARGTDVASEWRGYYGIDAYSEPETQAIGDFILSRDFVTVVDGHTYLEVYYMPQYSDEDAYAYSEVVEALNAWSSYEIRYSEGGGGTGNFVYHLTRGIHYTFEYGRISQPHYTNGFSAPGLETSEFGMIEGQLIWPSMGTRNHHTTHEASGSLIDAGIGQTMPENISGNIALIMRSEDISFANQVQNATAAGAAGVVLYNDQDYWMRGPVISAQPTIGVMAIKGLDGILLREHLATGNTMNVEISPNQCKQDTFVQLWERNFEPVMIMLERAKVYASSIEGTIVDRMTGDAVNATLTKEVDVMAVFGGVHTGEFLMHQRKSFIDVQGDYHWYMTPSKQPRHETNPFLVTATAQNYHTQQAFVTINQFQDHQSLHFNMQPLIEMLTPMGNQSWSKNAIIPIEFVTVDAQGTPVATSNLVIHVIQNGEIIQTLSDLNAVNFNHYSLQLATSSLALGAVELDIIYDEQGIQRHYKTSFELHEGVRVFGDTLLDVTANSQTIDYDAFAFDSLGQAIEASDIMFGLVDAPAGVSISNEGKLLIAAHAGPALFYITAEANNILTFLPVRLVTQEQKSALLAAEAAIHQLVPNVTIDDAEAIIEAREKVTTLTALGVSELAVSNRHVLVRAENKLVGYTQERERIDFAINEANVFIQALPETMTLADKSLLDQAWAYVERAYVLGALESEIVYLSFLIDQQFAFDHLIDTYVYGIGQGLATLPTPISLDDETTIKQIRSLYNDALGFGVDESLLLPFLNDLLAAEEAIETIYQEDFIRESLFALGNPGTDNYSGMDWFIDYNNLDRWRTDRTVGGIQFAPLKAFSPSLTMLSPRWIQYDISDRGYAYIEGWVGITDFSTQSAHPLDFVIYTDGIPVFTEKLLHGSVFFYRIDVSEVSTIRFEYSAETTSATNYANRVGIVEPQFLIPINPEIVDAIQSAILAIDTLPEYVSLLDLSSVEHARHLVEQAYELGVPAYEITNLTQLEDAEQYLEALYSDMNIIDSLFTVAPPVIEEVGLPRFVDYTDMAAWSDHRTIGGISYAPTRMYTLALSMASTNPRYVVYDISDIDYQWFEGYAGITDQDSQTMYPLDLEIFVDGVRVFHALLDRYLPAVFYSVHIEGASTLKFQYSAQATNASGSANRPGFVEPTFVKANIEGMLTTAVELIDSIPTELSPAHLMLVNEARRAVNNAYALGFNEADIVNLATLEAAEAFLADIDAQDALLALAIERITQLPEQVTYLDKALIYAAREAVEDALAIGIESDFIWNIENLIEAESELELAIESLFVSDHLFSADVSVMADSGWPRFVDYTDSAWSLDRTVDGVSFAPLHAYTLSLMMRSPRWVEYDLSQSPYHFVEGFVGIADGASDYPLDFKIFIDDVLVFDTLLRRNESAQYYRFDIENASTLKFYFEAQAVTDTGYASRPFFVEPLFLKPNEDVLSDALQEAILAIPDPTTPLDEALVSQARTIANQMIALNLDPSIVETYDTLLAAEQQLNAYAAYEGTMSYYVELADIAITRIPVTITANDKDAIFLAQSLIFDAYRAGAVSLQINQLTTFEAKLVQLRQAFETEFSTTSLLSMQPSAWQDGDLEEMSTRFSAYDDLESWDVGRRIFNQSFGDLKVYSRGHIHLDEQPQWIDYDLSNHSFHYLEGYIGIIDDSSAASFPPRFMIYGEIDGEWVVLFEVEELWRGEPPHHYFLDVSNVDTIRIYMDAEVVSGNFWTNRIALVEPLFYSIN